MSGHDLCAFPLPSLLLCSAAPFVALWCSVHFPNREERRIDDFCLLFFYLVCLPSTPFIVSFVSSRFLWI